MPGERVPDVAAWIVGAGVSISVAAFGIYINSTPRVSISCTKCEGPDGLSCIYAATEDINLWGMIQKHHWELSAIYLYLIIAGLCAVSLIVERSWVFYAAQRQSRQFQSKAGEALYRGQITSVIRMAQDYPDSPLAFVINATLANQDHGVSPTPSMRLRQTAIVAKTIELKRGLWQLSTIGWSLGLLTLLAFCAGAINLEGMIRYTEAFNAPTIMGVFSESLYAIVFCLLTGSVILVAHKFFAARIEHFQLEMDRLSLAFIEGVTSPTESLADHSYQSTPGVRCGGSRITSKVRAF